MKDKSVCTKCKGCYYASVLDNHCLKGKKKYNKSCENLPKSNVKSWTDSK